MRGARRDADGFIAQQRIIPADAGSTGRRKRSGSLRGDHPRGCGEHRAYRPDALLVRGSSPRMRGTLQASRVIVVLPGIIPADAGSTMVMKNMPDAGGDHPRGCGEHSSSDAGMNPGWGSSPRMRGAPAGHLPGGHLGQIIPADAGSTAVRVLCRLRIQDHPRGCGEHDMYSSK